MSFSPGVYFFSVGRCFAPFFCSSGVVLAYQHLVSNNRSISRQHLTSSYILYGYAVPAYPDNFSSTRSLS